MNISKLIAKFILASFVFSSVMQGSVLAIGGETGSKKPVNIRNQEIDRMIKNDPVIPFPVKKSGTPASKAPEQTKAPESSTQQPTTPGQNSGTPAQNPTVPTEVDKEAKTMLASLLARLPELPSKDALYAKLPSTGDMYNMIPSTADLYAKVPSKDGLCNGLYNIFKETKDGALNIVAKVTPESILKTKYGIETVTFVVVGGTVLGTAYAIYYVGVKKGGFAKIKTTLGSVKDFVVANPKSSLTVSTAAALAALAYKTDAKTAACVAGSLVAGAATLYGLKKLAGVAKNAVVAGAKYAGSTRPGKFVVSGMTSTKDLAVSAKDTVVTKVSNLVPSSVKTVGSKVVSVAKAAASYVPFVNKKITKPVQQSFVRTRINELNKSKYVNHLN